MDAGRGDFMAKFFGEIMPMVEAARPVAKVSARTTAEEQKLKDGILTALSQIKATGSFAPFKSVFDPFERRLVVQNVGPIKFPITKLQTRQLIKRARQAPYDKGNETLVDTSSEITQDHSPGPWKAWREFSNAMLKDIATDLGISTTSGQSIYAEPYKLLIHEEGAMFKAHTRHGENPRHAEPLRRTVTKWLQEPAQPKALFNVLSYTYTPASLSMRHLKSLDLLQTQILHHLSTSLPSASTSPPSNEKNTSPAPTTLTASSQARGVQEQVARQSGRQTHLYRVTALVLVATRTVPVSVDDDDDENVTPGVAESGAAESGIDVPAAAAPDVATPGVAATAENGRHIRVPVSPSRMVGAVRPSTMRNGYVPLEIVRDAVKRAREELGMNP
ncbi:hypothetical protein QC764_0038230 [Podospora pseudoanserina]|uniref:Uncharacterized protein n=1 Tax=Podospora pseudoanserina TaxID=2609844 RepID=A0ABR0IIX5_9PEZI|nr:hypothetical protein QC764_0038230 [Podospora pseudoanserina]